MSKGKGEKKGKMGKKRGRGGERGKGKRGEKQKEKRKGKVGGGKGKKEGPMGGLNPGPVEDMAEILIRYKNGSHYRASELIPCIVGVFKHKGGQNKINRPINLPKVSYTINMIWTLNLYTFIHIWIVIVNFINDNAFYYNDTIQV